MSKNMNMESQRQKDSIKAGIRQEESFHSAQGYEDIIDLPHHVSKTHPPMPRANRAAQFMPFAALTGYDDAVAETARLTDRRLDLDEDEKAQINEKLRMLSEKPQQQVRITHFVQDAKKEGGEYTVTSGCVKRIDVFARQILFTDGTHIDIREIILIEMVDE